MTYAPQYFSEKEFQGWYANMSQELLIKLDLFRLNIGRAVYISPAPGAVGRRDGSQSQHNVQMWGKVRAVDIFCGIKSRQDAIDAIAVAHECGFTGIGVYPDWKPEPGLHLDVRRDKEIGNPSTWAGILKDGKQIYVSLAAGLERMK